MLARLAKKQAGNPCKRGNLQLKCFVAADPVWAKLCPPATTNAMNSRKPTAAATPAPEPEDGILLSLEQILAIKAKAIKAEKAEKADKKEPAPVLWTPATVAAAAALPVPVQLPSRYPGRGPGATLHGEPGWFAKPKDLTAVNGPVCPQRRNDPLLTVIRCAILNDWGGVPIHKGPSAADGGIMPLPALLTLLQTERQQQQVRKWAHVLVNSGQTNLLAQVANVAARYAILRPDGIRLVQDFYAPAPTDPAA